VGSVGTAQILAPVPVPIPVTVDGDVDGIDGDGLGEQVVVTGMNTGNITGTTGIDGVEQNTPILIDIDTDTDTELLPTTSVIPPYDTHTYDTIVSVDITATDETLERHIACQLVTQVLHYTTSTVLGTLLQREMFINPIEECQTEADGLSDLMEIAEESLEKVKRFRTFCCEKTDSDPDPSGQIGKTGQPVPVVNIQVEFNDLYSSIYDSIPDLYKRVITVGNSLLSGNTSTMLELPVPVEKIPVVTPVTVTGTNNTNNNKSSNALATTATRTNRKAKFELRKKSVVAHVAVAVESPEVIRMRQETAQAAITKFYRDFYMSTTTAKAMITSMSEGSVSVVSDAVAKTYAYLNEIRKIVEKYKNIGLKNSEIKYASMIESMDYALGTILKKLKNEKILLLDNTHCFSMQVREACPGISDKAEVQVGTSLETIRNMVASNLGISILPQSATANNYSNDLINILPFESPIPFRRVAMAFRRGSSKQSSLGKIVKSITSVKEKIIAS